MEKFVTLLVPVFLLLVLIRLIMLPIKMIYKLFINSACGFVCLWLMNWISGFTGICFPINIVTAAIAGFLGLPGIGLLALIQVVL